MTVPLEYETRKAFAIPSLAALVVLTLAMVAAVIPMKPAVAESIPPTRNATAVRGWIPGARYSTIAKTTMNTAIALYWLFR
ncbi:MAG: hypothetical protein A4E38_00854 [Methanoregulaceae archaeon PtaB.Bin108]|nr:MAG: hypothetical protein A4E38_00854 [Methanoregulaceae archaeon PtaB.Bin108]